MRKKTLIAICTVLSVLSVYMLIWAVRLLGFRLPSHAILSLIFGSLIVSPILMIPLRTVNSRLLAWRKARGRDIEEEERYEIGDSEFISLKPKRPDNEVRS